MHLFKAVGAGRLRYNRGMNELPNVIQQRPEALVLAVLDNVTLPSVVYLQQAQYQFEDWIFQFAIIGQSHHIRVEWRGHPILNEVLACVSLTAAACVHYHTFHDLQSHSYNTNAYHVWVNFDAAPPWEIPQTSMAQLEFAFPRTYEQAPVTRIQWQACGNAVHWWTLHTYVEAQHTTYVHTKSIFRCENEGDKL